MSKGVRACAATSPTPTSSALITTNATSLPATVLRWCGIPESRWGLGGRVPVSESFESVFQRSEPREDKPEFPNPYDKSYPKTS
jgi:hypothetical protein